MNIRITSKFRPFSFDELLKPMLIYKEAYDKAEEDYNSLAVQTEQWRDIANQTKSPEAYAMFNKYATDLQTATENFSKGMTLQNKGQLLAMKRRYASDILPIAKASEAMKEANEFRMKMGPDAIFEVGEYNSLDKFLHGKTANNKYVSRDALTKRTAAMTEAAMASAMKDPEFQKALGNQYWMLTQHTGGSYEDLKAAIANNAQAQNRFAEIKAQVMKDAGYDRYDTIGKQAIEDAINTGLYAGLDKPARSFQANQNFQSDYQKDQLQLAKKQLSLSAANAGLEYNESTGKWERDPTLIINPVEGEASLSISDLEKQGYKQEEDSSGQKTGRIIRRDSKGKLKVFEPSPNGWIESREKNADKYIETKNKKDAEINNAVIKVNSENLTPFYFQAWSKGGSKGFEDLGNEDSSFSDSDKESTFNKNGKTKDLSISSDGGIHGRARKEVRNYILRFAGLQNSNEPISEERIDMVADKYFKIYRDQDWFSDNHFKVAFINNKGVEFAHKKEKDEETPQYLQDKTFRNTYMQMRKDLLSQPSSITQ